METPVELVDFGVASEAYLPIITWDIYEEAGKTDEGFKEALLFCKKYAAHRRMACPETKKQLESTIKKYWGLYKFVTGHLKENGPYYDIYQLHFYEEWDLIPHVVNWVKRHMRDYSGKMGSVDPRDLSISPAPLFITAP